MLSIPLSRFVPRVSCFAICALALVACANKPKPAPTPIGPDPIALESAEHNALTIKMSTDPCAINLQDIGSALAIFYRDNQGFPESLDSLRPIARRWKLNIQFTCPVSGEPYVYVPNGLAVPGQVRRLVIYDKTPAHDGWRWGVVMNPPAQGMVVVIPEVIYISQPVLDAYLKSASAPTPAPGSGQ